MTKPPLPLNPIDREALIVQMGVSSASWEFVEAELAARRGALRRADDGRWGSVSKYEHTHVRVPGGRSPLRLAERQIAPHLLFAHAIAVHGSSLQLLVVHARQHGEGVTDEPA